MTTPLLDDVTVLDFTRVLAGPYCTRLLADLGARVIKIERAGEQSVAIDLSHPDGRAVAHDLARHADVAIENFVPGVAAKLGIDAKTLHAINSKLVYCSISGFGQDGPLASWPAFAHIINAMSGMMDLERNRESAPRVTYLQAAVVLAGTHAFGAIAAALVRQARTGDGATLDVSMLEALVAAEDVSFGAALNGADISE